MSHAAPCLQAGARGRGSLKARRHHASCTASFGSPAMVVIAINKSSLHFSPAL